MRLLTSILMTCLVGCTVQGEDVLFASEATPSLCTVANAPLCEGFESDQIPKPPWYTVQYAATVTIDPTRSLRGAQSLRIHTNELGDSVSRRQGELTETTVLPQPEFFLRTFLFVPSPAPVARMRLFGFLQEVTPIEGPAVVSRAGQLQLQLSDGDHTSAATLPLDRWACLELRVRVSSSDTTGDGEVQVWIDEIEVDDLHFIGITQMSPPLGRLTLGAAFFGMSQPQPSFDFWYDEVTLDSVRVGCMR